MKPLEPWPRTNTILTPAQVQMIRDGLARAVAAGWTQREWAADCAAMLGVTPKHVFEVSANRSWKGHVMAGGKSNTGALK